MYDVKERNKYSLLIIGIAIGVIAMAIIATGLLLYFKPWEKPEPEIVKEIEYIVQPTPTPIIETVEIIKEPVINDLHLEELGELATETAYYTGAIKKEEAIQFFKTDWKIPLTKHEYLFTIDGIIKAGYDFSKIEYSIDHDRKIIQISLPECIILSNELDLDSVQVYDIKNNVFNPIKVTDVTDSLSSIKKEGQDRAKAHGLIIDARNTAVLLLTNMCHSILPEYDVFVN